MQRGLDVGAQRTKRRAQRLTDPHEPVRLFAHASGVERDGVRVAKEVPELAELVQLGG